MTVSEKRRPKVISSSKIYSKVIEVLVLFRELTDEIRAIGDELNRRKINFLTLRPSELMIRCNNGLSVCTSDGLSISPRVVLGWFSLHERIFGLHVLRTFESMGIPVVNDSQTLEICQSKILMSLNLTNSHVPHVQTDILGYSIPIQLSIDQLSFPIVVKSDNSAKGLGVELLKTKKEIDTIRVHSNAQDKPILLQKFVDRPERDIRVQCANYTPLFSFYRYASKGGFLTNLHSGGHLECPGPFHQELVKLTQRAAKVCNAPMAGVDIIEGEDGYRVLEVNSVPGFLTFARFSNDYEDVKKYGYKAASILVDLLLERGGLI